MGELDLIVQGVAQGGPLAAVFAFYLQSIDKRIMNIERSLMERLKPPEKRQHS